MQDTLDVESLAGKGERGRRRVELFGFARSKGSWSGFFVAHTTAGLVISALPSTLFLFSSSLLHDSLLHIM